jgi:hypothetical protein
LGGSFVADDELAADDVSNDVEPESGDVLSGDGASDEPEPESAGWANATAGVLAAAIATPSATANAQMPPMCLGVASRCRRFIAVAEP